MIHKYNPEQIEKMMKLCIFHEDDHGKNKQIIQTIKELNELAEELVPSFKEPLKLDWFKVLSELFDVEFMLFQLKYIFIKDFEQMKVFEKLVNNKLERELIRWGLD